MKKSFPSLYTIAMLFVLYSVSTKAQVVVKDTSFLLRPVVVSATMIPTPAANLTQAVTVLYGDDLRARGVTRVADALRDVPGAALVQSGSFGAVTSLFLRGGESRYTKVLVDGVAVNANGGFFDLSHLTTDNIDRIEIVRGPASVVYGADAVSGVVQIFTKRGEPGIDVLDHSFSARAGTYGSRDVDASIEHGGRTGFTLGGGLHSTDGIVPFNNQYKNGTLSASVRGSRTHFGEVQLSSRYTSADYHYPQDYTSAPVDSNSHRVQHRLTVAGDWFRYLTRNRSAAARVLVGSNEVSDLTEDLAVPFGATAPSHSLSLSRGFRRTAEGRVMYQLPNAVVVTSGIEYQLEKEKSDNRAGAVGTPPARTDAFVADRHTVAYYTEILGSAPGRVSYNVSGRIDDNSDFGSINSYRLGASVPLIGRFRLRGSLATAFNAPAFSQLRATTYTVASPNLQPERSRSSEIGFEQTWVSSKVHVSGAYFNQRFSQMIQYVDGGPPSFLGSYANLTGASSNGYEGEARILFPFASVTGNFSVAAPKVTAVSSAYSGSLRPGDALIRRPTHSSALRISRGWPGGLALDLSAAYVGKRPDVDFAQFPSPTVTLPSYVRLDASTQRPIATLPNFDRLSLTVRVENVLGTKYQDVLRYPAPGRVILIGASLRSQNSH